jgi:hypothetical protein
MRYTVLLNLREYGENRRTESRTSLIGLDDIALLVYRETVWRAESKERLSNLRTVSRGAPSAVVP